VDPVAKHFTLTAARSLNSQNLGNLVGALVVTSIVILFLYIGRAILEPLVIAALLAFILAPPSRWTILNISRVARSRRVRRRPGLCGVGAIGAGIAT
jgi:hypothetical protein